MLPLLSFIFTLSEEGRVPSVYLGHCEIFPAPAIARPAAPLHGGNGRPADGITKSIVQLVALGLLDRIKQLVSRYDIALRYFAFDLLDRIYRQTLLFKGDN